MLLKRGVDDRDDIRFFGQSAPEADTPLGQAEPGRPDPLQLANAELVRENDALKARLTQLEAQRIDDVAKARAQALCEAAAAHSDDDAARLQRLAVALDAARAEFRECLVDSAGDLAQRLAVAAVGQMMRPQPGDHDILTRAIELRLAQIDASAIVALHLPRSAGHLVDRIEGIGTGKIAIDPDLGEGEARIELVMGEVPVRLADGWERILGVLGDSHG